MRVIGHHDSTPRSRSALPHSRHRCSSAANWTMFFRPLPRTFEQHLLVVVMSELSASGPLRSQVVPSSTKSRDSPPFTGLPSHVMLFVQSFATCLFTLQTTPKNYPQHFHRSALATLDLKPLFIHIERWHRTALDYAVASLIKTSTVTERQPQASDFASAAQSARLRYKKTAQTYLPPEWMTSRRPGALLMTLGERRAWTMKEGPVSP